MFGGGGLKSAAGIDKLSVKFIHEFLMRYNSNMSQNSQVKPKVLVHIGYPKTGTTSLQKHIFNSFDGVCYLGLYDRYGDLYKFEESAIRCIYTESSLSFDNEIGNFLDLDDGKYIFSEENLLTECMIPSRGRKGFERRTQDIKTILSNIKAFFSCADVEILITIRKQREMIPSFYAQHYHKRFKSTVGMESANSYISTVLSGGAAAVYYDYNSVYDSAVDCFGAGKVKVMPMEMISSDSKRFIQEVGGVLGTCSSLELIPAENVRKEKGVYRVDDIYNLEAVLKKLLNRNVSSVILRNLRLPRSLFPTEFCVTESLLSQIDCRFSTSNRELSNKIGVGLDKYGYF